MTSLDKAAADLGGDLEADGGDGGVAAGAGVGGGEGAAGGAG